MIHFWRLHWLWCCCILHLNLVASDEETAPLYKKTTSEARDPVKFPDPKYNPIMRDIQDARRTGTEIVKKSNDHLEKQTAPNRLSRDSSSAENRTEEIPPTDDAVNASRNIRDVTNDTVTVIPADGNSTSKNDSIYVIGTDSSDTVTTEETVNKNTPAIVVLKNPKDNENKTKIDSNSFAKKVTINVKVKNTLIDDKPKISTVLNDTRDNSTDHRHHLNTNETSHNYNVTEDTSKNITFTAVDEDDTHNETKISATSRQMMPENPPMSTLNIALITVAAFVVVSTVTVIGMVSVVLYRRYHWNKPQTLSDKCSNADSTGYIDDSTLKENSEEMYSLDNDSFLNSLEAMTIQNYWADSIRHTKL